MFVNKSYMYLHIHYPAIRITVPMIYPKEDLLTIVSHSVCVIDTLRAVMIIPDCEYRKLRIDTFSFSILMSLRKCSIGSFDCSQGPS